MDEEFTQQYENRSPAEDVSSHASPDESGGGRRTRSRHERALLRTSIAAGVLVVGGLGAIIGHLAWEPANSNPLASTGTSDGGGRSSIGDGGGFQIQLPNVNGNPNTGGSASAATGAPANASAIAAAVGPTLVDINTTLGYQSGEAAGTGIVLSTNGLVLTNNHVITGATSIAATDIGNHKTYTAHVVGYDHANDVALIQLEHASGLKVARLGNSASLRVGDPVVGIGNAGGVGGAPSYAAGSVTALHQNITAGDSASGASEQLHGLIGTNANIQAGDSGGPLVNASGAVIGIDTAGSTGSGFNFTPSPGATTQGYAIPINQASAITKLIRAHKASATIHIGPTAFLGVQVTSTSNASGFGFGGFGGYGGFGNGNGVGNSGTATVPASGAYIQNVVPGTPAATSGLSRGDTIVSVGNVTIATPNSLTKVILQKKPGQTVSVGYIDPNGQQHTVKVTFGNGPAQ